MAMDDLELVDVEDLDEMLDVVEAYFDEEEEELAERMAMADALRGALHSAYAGANDEEMQDALYAVFDELNPAESFNFAKALKGIEQGASQLFSDPTVNQIAKTVLPLAGGAVGTIFGGPVGTALGGQLGNAVAGALPPARGAAPPPRAAPAPRVAPPQPVAPTPAAAFPLAQAGAGVPGAPPAAAGGSPAAARAFMLTQQPDVLRSLLSVALGQQGRQEVGGVPVGSVMSMLSSVFGRAAADADELMYLTRTGGGAADEEDRDGPDGGGLYRRLLGAENAALDEAWGLS